MSIVTLEAVKRHLRIEGTIDDALILENIAVAEAYVEGYVGPLSAFEDGIPDMLAKAIVLLVEHYFSPPSDAKDRADALILPYRKWSF